MLVANSDTPMMSSLVLNGSRNGADSTVLGV